MIRLLLSVLVPVLLLVGTTGARAADEAPPAETDTFEGSLLFTGSELSAIRAALAAWPAVRGTRATDDAGDPVIADGAPLWSIDRLRLSALVYYDARQWTLWLGKTRVEPGSLPPYLTDVQVTREHADMTVIRRPGAQPVPVRLRPNQTFLVAERRIIDGLGIAR